MDIEFTEEEERVMKLLGEAAALFFSLHPEHPSDAKEFEHHTHALQNLVLARPGYRLYQHQFGFTPEWKVKY